jgi:aspartyl/asparaginyl beta-hydroxylase (cupin superfamily)
MNFIERFRQLRRRTILRTGKRLIYWASRIIARQSLIGDTPVFDKSVFPWIKDFEADWKKIRAELEEVLHTREQLPSFHELSPDQYRISKGDNWKTFVFYAFGERFDPNCARCPETARLLDRVPRLRNAWFSILAPRYRIPPHKGPTNGIIRIHLGLIVPRDSAHCQIRVDQEVFGWEEGKCVVFDDYFEHEVWNDTDEQRVVLFLDVDRPLRPLGRLINALLLAGIRRSPYVRDARRNMLAWEERYREIEKTRRAA